MPKSMVPSGVITTSPRYLPAPLPMTWGIVKEFMAGAGGLGKAYRGLGFHPSERVNNDGILDLICGRIYVNLNREAELYFEGFPFVHDFNALKQNPQQAMYAQGAPRYHKESGIILVETTTPYCPYE